MEGKEARFGTGLSTIWGVSATATSNGSVNSMHDSWTPIAGLVPLVMMDLGEVVFGGVGLRPLRPPPLRVRGGLHSWADGGTHARVPRQEDRVLRGEDGLDCPPHPRARHPGRLGAGGGDRERARPGTPNPGPHGFSEILYAFSSAGQNNGSAFAGLNANTPFYNAALGIVILFGRFWPMVPVLAIAGLVAAKKSVPVSAGTLPTHTPLFMVMLVSVILIMGALTYFPAARARPHRRTPHDAARPGSKDPSARGNRMSSNTLKRPLFDPPIVRQAAIDSFRKLDPRLQLKNPVMFVVLVGSVLTTGLWFQAVLGHGEAPAAYILAVSLWLWFTVLFANFAEAMAEGTGKAQADTLARRDER